MLDEYVWKSRYFFSQRMWHHAGRPTTGHCEETIGINIISPQETEHYTLMRNKWKIKARISPKNELDLPLSFNELSKSESYFKRFSSFKPGDINIIRKLSIRRNRFWQKLLNRIFPLIEFWITKTIALLYLASSLRLYWLLNISFNI